MTKEIIDTTKDLENLVFYEFTLTATLQVPVEMKIDSESLIGEHQMIQEGSNKIYDALIKNFVIANDKKNKEKILIKSQYYFGGKKIPCIAYTGM
jgi:hypothetical protein